MELTILILCHDYDAAERYFYDFYDFLESNIPWTIGYAIERANLIYMSNNIRYIFIDSVFCDLYESFHPEFMDENEFLDYLYDCDLAR